MNIQFHSRHFPLTDGIRDHVSWRLSYALNHGRDRVARVVVHLADTNGPRGGVDKSCSIEVRLKGLPALVIEDVQSDLYVAIDRATERIGRSLDRRLARLREYPAAFELREES